jgi:hypothetical protein
VLDVGVLAGPAFSEMLIALVGNLVAAVVLIFGIYFRRHRRRDLVLGYFAFNVSLFAVAAALGSAESLGVGVGFGLFAVLSIVRLRSDEATQAEIGYTMVALVLGLLNGLPTFGLETKLLFTLVLLATIYVVDHPAVLPGDDHARCRVTLDVVLVDAAELRAALETRLAGTVQHVIVQDIDFVRETMRLDVRYRQHAARGATAQPQPQPSER